MNIGKAEYSEEEKKTFTELLINIANKIFNYSKLKYEISGSGYRISKGDDFIGEKSLQNKFAKQGYKNLYSFTANSNSHTYKSGFLIPSKDYVLNRIDMYFSWPYTDSKSIEKAIEVIKLVSEKFKIDYAYAYSDNDILLESGEWKMMKGIFSVNTRVFEQEKKWQSKLSDVLTGTIKKLYPLNIFNKKQVEQLQSIEPETKIQLSDENEIWIFDTATLDENNLKVKTKIID